MMMRNFVLHTDNVRAGRAHTMLTSVFSHVSLTHLGFNMLTLYFFSRSCMQVQRGGIGDRSHARGDGPRSPHVPPG